MSSTLTPEDWPRIYIGPSVSHGFLKTNQVFKDSYPVPVVQILTEHPELSDLFVPLSEMTSASRAVAIIGTSQHAAWKRAAAIFHRR